MKICSVVFNYQGTNAYDRLARVLEYTAGKFCPSARFELVRIPAPMKFVNKRCFASNTVKLAEWLRIMNETDDDVVFMDCDTAILRDISPAFVGDFDIGYTTRTRGIPFNCGVVFVRNTPAAKQFVSEWRVVNDKMYANAKLHNPYRHKYAGINQAAFGYLLEHGAAGAALRKFPCHEWNACKEDWPTIDGTTRVLHVKSDLRRMIVGGVRTELCGKNIRAVRVWRDLEQQALAHTGPRVASAPQEVAPDEQYRAFIDGKTGAPLGAVVVQKSTVMQIAKIIKRTMQPGFGVCHGSGMGYEQRWFAAYLPGCEVVGTEIADNLLERPKTVKWDFNRPNPEWRGSVDFIYSNSLSCAFDQRQTLAAWLDSLKPKGVLFVEHRADLSYLDDKGYAVKPIEVGTVRLLMVCKEAA